MALGGIVRGRRTTLRTPIEDDLASFNRWMADMRLRHAHRVWHEPAMPATWKERLAEQTKDRNAVLWSIESDTRLVGLVRFEFGWNDRSWGWVDQLVIGPDVWRQGLGTDAALALHRYLFDYLDLRRVNMTMRADNSAAAAIARRLGYTEFGHGKDVFYRDGTYVDEIWLLCDRAAWNERFADLREYVGGVPFGAGVPRSKGAA